VLVIFDDVSPLNRMETDTFKSLTGEGLIRGKQLYQTSFVSKYKGMCILTSNHQVFSGLDTGLRVGRFRFGLTKCQKVREI